MQIKKWFYSITIGLLIWGICPLISMAELSDGAGKYTTKDEVIYVNLNASGQTKNMYVVNSFEMINEGKVIDYGKYNEVRNLTDLTPITQPEPDSVHFQAGVGKFFYQGELQNKRLPWNLSITYLIDGKVINPEELPGKSGHLEMKITTTANEHVNPLFFEHFLLQISLTLDPEIFRDIQAPKGTEANEGKNKQITFTVLPEQEEVLIVSAHVTRLEMDPIRIAAIPANIAFENPDLSEMTEGMGMLSRATKDLHKGVGGLKEGTDELKKGALALSKGSGAFQKGINELDQSSGSLVNGSEQILGVFRQINEAMNLMPEMDLTDVNDLQEVPQLLRDLANNLREFAIVLDELNQVMNRLPAGIDQEQMDRLSDLIEESDLDNQLIEQIERSNEVTQLIKEMNESIPSDLPEDIANMVNGIEELADQIEQGMDGLGTLADLANFQAGLMTLSTEYETFHNGLVIYTSGVHSLATSYRGIDEGIGRLKTGIDSVHGGIEQLYEGTRELQNQTSDLPDEIQSKMDEFMETYDFSSYKPVSFVSDQNKEMGVIQFVFQTERLEIEDPIKEVAEKTTSKSLWTRFLDLFR